MRKPREPSRILKKFPAHLDEVAREKAIDVGKIEIWFQDEALGIVNESQLQRFGISSKVTALARWEQRLTAEIKPAVSPGENS
jgi:hypothetical protein